jgi:hypothetical protein
MIFAQSFNRALYFQLSKQDIINLKIKKISISYSNSYNGQTEYFFDEKGNDTGLCSNGRLIWTKKYQKDKLERLTKMIQVDSNRVEKVAAIYTYESDGSYCVDYTNMEYNVHSGAECFNKEGKIQQEFLNDGGRRIFLYDSLGRVKEIRSEPGLDNLDLFNAEYHYNMEGELDSVKISYSRLNYTEILDNISFNKEGLLLKTRTTRTYNWDNVTEIELNYYRYVYEN